MGIGDNFVNRSDRLNETLHRQTFDFDSPLVKVVNVKSPAFVALQQSILIYIWNSLTAANPGKNYLLNDSLLVNSALEINQLPNLTPNGLLVPRNPTFLTFNLVQSSLVNLISSLGLDAGFETIQAPCNIRIVSGIIDDTADKRPYSSSKIHTDVWYGEPTSSVLFNLPVLGDAENIRMKFFEPSIFPKRLRTPLDDYNKGQEVIESAKDLKTKFEIGLLHISDSLSLHQTFKSRAGLRVSLDWRAIPKKKLDGELEIQSTSRARYVSINEFLQGGTEIIYCDGYPIDAFQRKLAGKDTSKANQKLVEL